MISCYQRHQIQHSVTDFGVVTAICVIHLQQIMSLLLLFLCLMVNTQQQ